MMGPFSTAVGLRRAAGIIFALGAGLPPPPGLPGVPQAGPYAHPGGPGGVRPCRWRSF